LYDTRLFYLTHRQVFALTCAVPFLVY
jgi:hypothetical protein